ncbi:MAG: shikimate kinase [Prevotella sp.]|nr:shikimate kinase [Prevotella sp.]
MTRVVLIGYMGVGKTTVGKALARALGLTFYDTDWYIESRMRQTVKDIFDSRGEDGFRQIEHNMLHEVAEFEDVVISCGGGTPCFFDNMDYLNRQGETIYMKAPVDVILRHLEMGKGVRPLLMGLDEEEKRAFITEQLAAREQYYSRAKHILPVSLMDSNEAVAAHVGTIRDMIDM